jgi:hypothetical protein
MFMNEQRFETGKSPHVVVSECGGALVIGSWKGTAVLAQSPELTADTPGPEQLELSSSGDLTLTVPEKASITIKNCTGMVTIKHVDGVINVGTVGGAVTLNDVGGGKIKVIAGDFHGENINGPLALRFPGQRVMLRNVTDVTVQKAFGAVEIQYANGEIQLLDTRDNVSLHTISGDVLIGRAWGNKIVLSNLGGKNVVEDLRGELQLVGGLANGEHKFETMGDILVAWPVDAPLTLVAEAAIIDNQLPLADATTTKLDDGRTQLTGHIEQGKPFVSLKTTGNIGLKPLRPGETAALSAADFDFSPPPTLDEIVATAVAATFPDASPSQIEQIADVIETYQAQVENPITTPSLSTGQIAAAKAQQKVEKSLQKAKDSISEAQTKLSQPPPHSAAKSELTAPSETQPEVATAVPTPPSQIQILQLLKDGLVTIEQANLLLNNLRET